MAYDRKNFPTKEEITRATQETAWFKIYKAQPYSYINEDSANPTLSKLMTLRLKEFFGADREKAQLLDRALNAGRKIVDSGTTYMFRRPFRVRVTDNEEVQKKVEGIIQREKLRVTLPESSKIFQAVGHTHFKVWKEEGKAKVVEVPYDNWFPNWTGIMRGQEPKNPRLAFYMTIDDREHVYVEDYEGNICTKALYQGSLKQIGERVDLSKTQMVDASGKPLSGMELTEVFDGLDAPPFVTINRSKTIKDRFGQSIYEPVLPQLLEINDRLTQVSLQFLKHLNAKLEIPETAVKRNDDGSVSMRSIEVILTKPGDQPSRYVTNDNPLIETAFTHMDRCLTHIAKFTQTPEDFLTGAERGVERVEAMRIRMDDFIARIEQDQAIYAAGIESVLRLCLKIEGVGEADTIPMMVEFGDPLPRDREVDMRIWSEAYNTGLASRETAVKQFQGIEGESLTEELEKIEEEQSQRTMSNLANSFAAFGQNGDQNPAQV